MLLPEPRGPLSEALFRDLTTGTLAPATAETAERIAPDDVLNDDDLQISLAALYELHYRGFDDVPDAWEWDPSLLGLRAGLERRHLDALHERTGPIAVREAQLMGDVRQRTVKPARRKASASDPSSIGCFGSAPLP